MATNPDSGGATWAPLPYDEWHDTCDTLHAHTQVLGKLAAALAPPEPELQHAALRLTPRGWETAPLPAPDGSGAFVARLDLKDHHAVVEHAAGPVRRVRLTPDRTVGEVTRELLGAVGEVAGPVSLNLAPQEVPWTLALDADDEHATYDEARVGAYLGVANRAALVLGALRAPYRGRSTPVNAWWGSFDLAVSLFSGRPADPPGADFITRNSADAQQVEIGWWPGDARHPRAAFFGFAFPAPEGFAGAPVAAPGRWDDALGEYLLDWDDVIASPRPGETARTFCRSVVAHACLVCEWDPELAASARGTQPAVT